MSKYLVILSCCVLLVIAACSRPGESPAKEMAGDICHAMSLINSADTMSVVEAKSALAKIARNKRKYKHVTEDELLKAMQVICPDGALKFQKILKDE
jgi:hypothetical protein